MQSYAESFAFDLPNMGVLPVGFGVCYGINVNQEPMDRIGTHPGFYIIGFAASSSASGFMFRAFRGSLRFRD